MSKQDRHTCRTLRRSIAAAMNELSAERRPFLTENQVSAMTGGSVEKSVERAFGAVGDSPRSACYISTMDVSCYYFCKV
jgi:hypothetical protein